jgi:hypothetical protein
MNESRLPVPKKLGAIQPAKASGFTEIRGTDHAGVDQDGAAVLFK